MHCNQVVRRFRVGHGQFVNQFRISNNGVYNFSHILLTPLSISQWNILLYYFKFHRHWAFGSYEDYEKAGFYVANRQKVVPLQVILYGMAYYSVITAFLRLHFIYLLWLQL
jgi:hypothetical protein